MKQKITFIFLISTVFIFLIFYFQRISSSTALEPAPDEEIHTPPEPVRKPTEIDGILQDYSRWLDAEIEEAGTVGAAIAVVYKDQIALMKTYGVQKAGGNDSIDEHTLFRLASVSKTITGVLAGVLEAEGLLRLDEKVVDHLPGFRLKTPGNTRDLKIRNLLSHTSGLIPHAYDNMVEEKVPVGKILERLCEVEISAPPGQLYSYQNVMFSLIDTILSVKTGQKYPELVRKKIFEPFGMNDASVDFQSFKYSQNKAFPHIRGKNGYWPTKLNDRYYSTAPAAGVNASISDMARFLLALLKKDAPGMTLKTHQAVFSPQVVSPLSRRYLRQWNGVDSKYYAIGWRIIGYKGRKVAYHGGYVQGYKAEIAFCGEENTGIVYLTNSPGTVASQTIPRFLDKLFEFQNNRRILTHNQDSVSSPTGI